VAGENKEAVKEAMKRVVMMELPYVSVSKLEMAPVFVDFVAVTWQAEVHGAEVRGGNCPISACLRDCND